tara:strand:+ start:650 stop:982 length:333 start_codon:yes stop_codon:yes gene_type:complete
MDNNEIRCDGAIFTNKFKDKDTKPDWTGDVEMSKAMLKELVNKLKAGEVGENGGVILKQALWNRTSKNGNEYKYSRLEPKKIQVEDKPVAEPVASVNDDTNTFNDEDLPF